MIIINRVILIGRLSRDPELRTTPNNISVARFSLAVSRPFTPNRPYTLNLLELQAINKQVEELGWKNGIRS